MKIIFSILGVKLKIVPTNYFAYHFILKLGKKEFSNANTDFGEYKKNIKIFTSKVIRLKLISTIISNILCRKIKSYYSLNN